MRESPGIEIELVPARPDTRRGQLGSGSIGSITARRQLFWLILALALASLPVVLDRSSVRAVVALYPLAEGSHPFWIPSFGWLLYVRAPLVTVSAMEILLAPGLLIASAVGATRTWSWWMLCGLALSLIIVSIAAEATQGISGTPLTGGSFLLMVSGCAAVAAAIAWKCAGKTERRMVPPLAAGNAVESAIAIAVILAILLPKFMWENFNGDGADALEVARLLLHQAVPFWPAGSGTVAAFPGITSMLFAYPASWFVRIFGALEFSARAPMLLALLGVHAGIVALAECNMRNERRVQRRLRRSERLLIWGALLVYTIVVAYSATYNPYSADIAMPGAQDTLFVAMFAATIVSFASAEMGWMALFGLLSYIALPSGLLLLGMLSAAALVAWRPVPERMVVAAVTLVIMCVAIGVVAPHALRAIGLPVPGSEYATDNLAGRLMTVQFSDWRRILYMVVPCGIAPVAAIFLWKKQDALARVIALIIVGYFLFTYLQAFAKLHYYVPTMLLPIALYWRIAPLEHRRRGEWRVAAFAGLCGAIVLALPERAAPLTSARHIASDIQIRVAGYDRSAPAEFKASDALELIFPLDWNRRVPFILGDSPLVWNYYLQHDTLGPGEKTDYVVQADEDMAPPGFHVIGHRNGFAVLARNDSLLAKQRALRLPAYPGSPLFRMSPGILFDYATTSNGAPIHDIIDALTRRGIPVGNILNRTGIKH